MFKWEGDTGEYTIELESGSPIAMDEPLLQLLALDLRALNAAVALASLAVIETAPGTFSYTFSAKDSRLWSQGLYIEPTKTLQTFNVTDKWSDEEFIPHRAVRARLTLLIRKFAMTKLEVLWP